MFRVFPNIASIDVGSSSVILLVAKKENNNVYALVQKEEVYKFNENNFDNLCEILEKFRSLANMLGAKIKAIAITEAILKPDYQDEILRLIEKHIWIKASIVSKEEEAKLSYKAGAELYGQDILTVNIGKRSTEFYNGKKFLNIPIGALTLSEQMGSIPGPEYKKWAKSYFKEINFKPFVKKDSYFVGGTAIALAMLSKEMKEFDIKAIEGQTISIAEIERAIIHLSNLSKDLRNAVPGLEHGRGDNIICGLYMLLSLCEKLKIDSIKVSTRSLIFGLLYD